MRLPATPVVVGWAAILLIIGSTGAWAGEADVVAAGIVPGPNGTWRFDVTVKHADTGWDHYADKWDITAEDGTVLAERVLYHPHVDEQPFQRSLSGVKLPPGTTVVVIRAHDSVHGYGGKTVRLSLER